MVAQNRSQELRMSGKGCSVSYALQAILQLTPSGHWVVVGISATAISSHVSFVTVIEP